MSIEGDGRVSDVLREALWGASQSSGKVRPAFVDKLLKHLAEAGDETLSESLLGFAGPDLDRRSALTDSIGRMARQLTPGDGPQSNAAIAGAWDVLVEVAHRLNGSGVHSLGRLDFLSDELVAELLAESRAQRPESAASRRATGAAGDALAALASSRQLHDAVEGALGVPVEPTWDALYEYDPPGSHVRIHVDSRDFEIVYHLLLDHEAIVRWQGASILTAYLPGRREPHRMTLRPGDSLVLRGRGTIHSWKALGEDERRTLIAIGFKRADTT